MCVSVLEGRVVDSCVAVPALCACAEGHRVTWCRLEVKLASFGLVWYIWGSAATYCMVLGNYCMLLGTYVSVDGWCRLVSRLCMQRIRWSMGHLCIRGIYVSLCVQRIYLNFVSRALTCPC